MQFVNRTTKKISRGNNSMQYIMLHHTGDANNAKEENVVNYVVSGNAQISYHYLVGRAGTIYKLAEDNQITRHAGAGSLNGIVNRMNDHAIGIAVISNGTVFTDAQRKAVKELTEYLM